MMKTWEYPPWSQEEDERILEEIQCGIRKGDQTGPWLRLSEELGRTHGAVRMRAYLLRERQGVKLATG